MKRYSNELVMFLGISIALGGIFSDFSNNPKLMVGISLSAVCFAFFDLSMNFYENSLGIQRFTLFFGVFAIIVIPYLTFLTAFLEAYNNYFSLFSLAVVIFLIGFRQTKIENDNEKRLDKIVKQYDEIIANQKRIILEKEKIIEALHAKLKSHEK